MNIKRKSQIFLALLITSTLLFQSCATIIKGTSQGIPVTSNPTGAKILVDGEEIGYTPLLLKLKKKNSHIIRVEKQDYSPLEIKIERNTSATLSLLGNTIWGLLVPFLEYFIFRIIFGMRMQQEALFLQP